MINVTKTYLPDFDEYTSILKRAWDKAWVTNSGELVIELEQKLKEFLGVKNFIYTTNGTVVLQMALKGLNITKEVITTPFSYVATTNAILWEGCIPVFADIAPDTFCIDPDKIEAVITENSQAILATHVYGLPCNVTRIESIAKRHNLKVIYDAAHAFGTEYNKKSILSYGDIATCSFHATKLFHTVEGGCIISNDDDLQKKLFLMRCFGHINEEYFTMGINAKNSEFHAAMGLALLPHIKKIIYARKEIHELYIKLLSGSGIKFMNFDDKLIKFNYAYFPVIFPSEEQLLTTRSYLERNEVNTRRYFYPSLNKLPFLKSKQPCPVSEDIAARVLCLPMYPQLQPEEVKKIATLILKCTKG